MTHDQRTLELLAAAVEAMVSGLEVDWLQSESGTLIGLQLKLPTVADATRTPVSPESCTVS